MRLKVVFDGKEVAKKLQKITTKLPVGIGDVVAITGQKVKEVARRLVPKDTRATHDGILSVVDIRNKNNFEVRVGFQSNPHPGKTWSQGEFVLPRYMTFSPNAKNHFRNSSGDPHFMKKASEYARTTFGVNVAKRTKNIIYK